VTNLSRHRVVLCVVCVAWLAASAAAGAAPSDPYIEGYATAIVERELGLGGVQIQVTDGRVAVRAPDLSAADRARITAALSRVPGVVAVTMVEAAPASTPVASAPRTPDPPVTTPPPTAQSPAPPASPSPPPTAPTEPPASALGETMLANGLLRPGTLFSPLLADPRWPHLSVSAQRYLGDREFRNVGSATLGETLSVYRAAAPFGGQWEAGVQAAVFAIFDLDAESKDLINADYLGGLFASYRRGQLQAMARLFHQSSHLGDEFLLRSKVDRVNLSYEAADLRVAYGFLDGAIRPYAGGSVLFDQDPSRIDPGAIQYGVELYSPWTLARGALRPFLAVDLQQRQHNAWSVDLSVRTGVQLESLPVWGRKLSLALEYFTGHSPNGQFFRQNIDYIGIGLHLY
jgi:hypothetical protein